MTDQERDKAAVKRIYADGWNKGDMNAVDEIFVPDLKHDAFMPGWPTGRESFKKLVHVWREAFPDLREDVVEIIAEGDQVACRIRISGTHRGDFYGIAGTGRSFTIHGAEIFRLKDGKVVEYAYSEDMLGLFFQLRALPLNHPAFVG